MRKNYKFLADWYPKNLRKFRKLAKMKTIFISANRRLIFSLIFKENVIKKF